MNNKTINELKLRDLDICYFTINIAKSYANLYNGKDVSSKEVIYTITGCNINGIKKYISIVSKRNVNKTSEWYDLFQYLKKRNIKEVIHFVIPNEKEIKDAIRLSFPNSKVFINCFCNYDKICNYFSESYTKGLLSSLVKIYSSNSLELFDSNVKAFNEINKDYQYIIDLTKDLFNLYRSYFNLDPLLRKHIFNIYFYRDFNMFLHKTFITKKAYNSINDIEELLLPIIQRIEARKYCPIKEWNQVIAILYKNNKELIENYI